MGNHHQDYCTCGRMITYVNDACACSCGTHHRLQHSHGHAPHAKGYGHQHYKHGHKNDQLKCVVFNGPPENRHIGPTNDMGEFWYDCENKHWYVWDKKSCQYLPAAQNIECREYEGEDWFMTGDCPIIRKKDLQGAPGETGATGPKGDKGDKGDTGERGLQGLQGPKGDTGDQGPKGDPGDGGTGTPGADGQDGADGADGTIVTCTVNPDTGFVNSIQFDDDDPKPVLSVSGDGSGEPITHAQIAGEFLSATDNQIEVIYGDPASTVLAIVNGNCVQVPRCRLCAEGTATPAMHDDGEGLGTTGDASADYFSFRGGNHEGVIEKRVFYIKTGKRCSGSRQQGGAIGSPVKLHAVIRESSTVEGPAPADWWWAHRVEVVCKYHFTGPQYYYIRVEIDATVDVWDDLVPTIQWELYEVL